ncbi:MAG: HAD-IA family hydrolase [Candidatus Aminicenantes bacterium]|nr:HAD-IA family hydrolase [Candidatus Aminicenantes bacterium]
MIESLISDLGNVLLFFDNSIFFERMAQAAGRPADDIGRIVHDHLDLNILFERNAVTPEVFHRNAVDLLEADVGYEDFYAAYCDVFSLNRKVLDLYRRLKPGLRMVLLSNTDVMRWTFIKSRFPEILFFDGYVLSFDQGFMKPQPEVYREALRLAGTPPERSLFVDDLGENVDHAVRLGLQGLVFRADGDFEAELLAFGLSG